MAEELGRAMTVEKAGTKIAGLREKTFSMNSEGIDIETDDDTGFRKFLAGASGTEALDISFSGITKNTILRAISMNPASDKMLTDIVLVYANGDEISGNFRLGTYEEGGEYKGATTFSGTLQSSGPWAYTAAP